MCRFSEGIIRYLCSRRTGRSGSSALEQLPRKRISRWGNTLEHLTNGGRRGRDLLCPCGRSLARRFRILAVKWVHSRSAGWTECCHELAASPVPLTNGRGVSASRWANRPGALLIREGLPPNARKPDAGRGSSSISTTFRADAGHRGLWRYWPRRGDARSRHGMQILALKRHGPPLYNVDRWSIRFSVPRTVRKCLSRCDYVVVTNAADRRNARHDRRARVRGDEPTPW